MVFINSLIFSGLKKTTAAVSNSVNSVHCFAFSDKANEPELTELVVLALLHYIGTSDVEIDQ